MYICYVDESGHNGKKHNPDQPVQVLCGTLVDVTKIHKTQRELNLLLKFLGKHGIPIAELKASDAYRGRKHWSAVKPGTRDKIFEMILNWARERSCKFIVCPIDTGLFFARKAMGCPIATRLEFPYEAGALNVLVAIQRHQVSKKNNKGKTIVVFDEQHGHDDNLIRLLEGDLSFTDCCTGYVVPKRAKGERRLDQVIDAPHFSKSHLSILIQIADWAGFITSTYLNLAAYKHPEKYPGELAKLAGWHQAVGDGLVFHTSIDPPGKGPLNTFFRDMRPPGWTAKKWLI